MCHLRDKEDWRACLWLFDSSSWTESVPLTKSAVFQTSGVYGHTCVCFFGSCGKKTCFGLWSWQKKRNGEKKSESGKTRLQQLQRRRHPLVRKMRVCCRHLHHQLTVKATDWERRTGVLEGTLYQQYGAVPAEFFFPSKWLRSTIAQFSCLKAAGVWDGSFLWKRRRINNRFFFFEVSSSSRSTHLFTFQHLIKAIYFASIIHVCFPLFLAVLSLWVNAVHVSLFFVSL